MDCSINRLEQRFGANFSKIFKTITFDNGSEYVRSDDMERNGRTTVYYAHPYSSWERGTNENWNGIDIKTAKDLMGHSDIRMTDRI
jgi:transposase, IS30 family